MSGPYEQILLFGDSLTQGSARNRWIKQQGNEKETESQPAKVQKPTGLKRSNRQFGFCFTAALQNGKPAFFDSCSFVQRASLTFGWLVLLRPFYEHAGI